MSLELVPLINGRAYDFAQVELKILGVVIKSCSQISYSEEQDKVNNYGAGKRPVSRGHGAINATANFTISMNDTEALRNVAPNGSLLNIPAFDIPVTFLNEQGVQTHVVKNCEFINDGVSGSQGDTDMVFSFDLTPSHIKWR